jgi:hypothetical protein
MGTRTHDGDLEGIRSALAALARRDDVVVEMIGAVTASQAWADEGVLVRDVPPGEQEYPLFLTWWSEHVSWDVGLAPLAANRFNSCKSDVKFLDYASIGAVGIYGARPADWPSVRHGENGYFADEDPQSWVDAVDALVADDEMRMRMARAASEDLWRERILAHRARDLVAALARLAR